SGMRKVSRVTTATLDVLELLVKAHDQDLYAYVIAQRSGHKTGAVVPMLSRFESYGWATSWWGSDAPGRRGPRRRLPPEPGRAGGGSNPAARASRCGSTVRVCPTG